MINSRMNAKPQKINSISSIIKKLIFHSHGFPIFLLCAIIAVLFVLFRMKAVETDYAILSLNDKIDKARSENKELQAKKARLLSIKNLRDMAKKYKLSQPNRKQIIIVPSKN